MSPIQGIIFNTVFLLLNIYNLMIARELRSKGATWFVSVLIVLQLFLIGWFVGRLF